MRKAILVAIMLVATCLSSVAGFSSPAEARSCGSIKSKIAVKAVNVDMGGPFSNATYQLTNNVRYRDCTGPVLYKRIEAIDWYVQRTDGKAGPISYYRANPNVIGTWNPGAKESNGAPGYWHFDWNAPNGNGVNIYANQPSNERCLGGYVTFVANNLPDITKDLSTVCVI